MAITLEMVNRIDKFTKLALAKNGLNCWCNECQSFFSCPTDSGGACRNCGSSNWIELTVM